MNRNEPVIVSLLETLERERAAVRRLTDAWGEYLIDRHNRADEAGAALVEADIRAFGELVKELIVDEDIPAGSAGQTPEARYKDLLHKETNAVAVYIVEGTGRDEFNDPVRVQLTRKEIHDLDVTTKTGAALFDGVVQLNMKAVTDGMAKSQHVDVTQAYAYTQLVPVLKRGNRDA